MILPWVDLFGQRTAWSLIHFLNYVYLDIWPSVLYFCSLSIILNYWTKLKYFFQCAQRFAVTELSSEHKITIAIFHRHFFGALVDFRASSVLTALCFFTRFTIFFSIPFFLALVVFHKKIVILPTPSAFITETLTLIHILPSFYLFFTLFCIHICGA